MKNELRNKVQSRVWKEWFTFTLRALVHCSYFLFLSSSVMFLFCLLFLFSEMIPVLFMFSLVFKTLILQIFLIITDDNYSMFRDVSECSEIFRNVPCFWFYRRPCGDVFFDIWMQAKELRHLYIKRLMSPTQTITADWTAEKYLDKWQTTNNHPNTS